METDIENTTSTTSQTDSSSTETFVHKKSLALLVMALILFVVVILFISQLQKFQAPKPSEVVSDPTKLEFEKFRAEIEQVLPRATYISPGFGFMFQYEDDKSRFQKIVNSASVVGKDLGTKVPYEEWTFQQNSRAPTVKFTIFDEKEFDRNLARSSDLTNADGSVKILYDDFETTREKRYLDGVLLKTFSEYQQIHVGGKTQQSKTYIRYLRARVPDYPYVVQIVWLQNTDNYSKLIPFQTFQFLGESHTPATASWTKQEDDTFSFLVPPGWNWDGDALSLNEKQSGFVSVRLSESFDPTTKEKWLKDLPNNPEGNRNMVGGGIGYAPEKIDVKVELIQNIENNELYKITKTYRVELDPDPDNTTLLGKTQTLSTVMYVLVKNDKAALIRTESGPLFEMTSQEIIKNIRLK